MRSVQVAIFVCLILTLMIILDHTFTQIVPTNTVVKNYWLLSKKKESYDMAFIGPSRVLHSIDCEVFEQRHKGKAINLGLSGVGYAEQYLVLRKLLEENEVKIKQLFIEVSYYNLIDPDSAFSYPFHEYYYFPYIQTDYVYEVIKDNSKKRYKSWAWKNIPFMRYAEYNSNLRPLVLFTSTLREGSGDSEFDKYGTIYLNEASKEEVFKPHYYTNSEMNEKTILYLEKMIALAKRNSTEVILFTSPVYSKVVSFDKKTLLNYKNTVNRIVSENKLEYYDFEHHVLCDSIANFYDVTHLNKRGAIMFSQNLSDSLLAINE